MNLAIFKIGSDKIHRFIINALVDGNAIIGDNGKVTGINKWQASMDENAPKWDYMWTDDIATPVFIDDPGDEVGEIVDDAGHTINIDRPIRQVQIGYDKVVSELTPAATSGPVISKPGKNELRPAAVELAKLAGFTYADVENFVDTNVADAGTAKVLKRFGKVLLGIIKLLARRGIK